MTITLETDAGTVTLMPEEYELFLEDSIRQANARVYGQGFFDRKYTVDEDTPDHECPWEEPGTWLAPGSPPLEGMSWSRWSGTDLEGSQDPDRLVAEHRLECDGNPEPVNRQANDRLFVESLSDIMAREVRPSGQGHIAPAWATDVRYYPPIEPPGLRSVQYVWGTPPPPPVRFDSFVQSCGVSGCDVCDSGSSPWTCGEPGCFICN